MKKNAFLLALLMIFQMVVPVQASTQIPDLNVKEEYGSYNGAFVVSVMIGDEWTEVGSLEFDNFQSEKTIEIGSYLKSGSAFVSIAKSGGGAAYIDSVKLAENYANNVNGEEGKLLYKLSVEDFDVTPIDENGVVLEFTVSNENALLSVVGRIENKVISNEPLQFPEDNSYKSKQQIKNFYTYTINSDSGSIKVDGVLDEVTDIDPFVKEYRIPGSGHPSGDIYFWVMNDKDNLYVTIDMTPDNTFDGDKDYAKVYINTVEGIKEYKVSVPETTWGNTAFTYTSNVGYEHKVYEFSIPLEEISIENLNDGKTIDMAFAVYGTAALYLGYNNPDVAYDTENDVYLNVFEYITQPNQGDPYSRASHIYGELVDNEGNTIGDKFLINDDFEFLFSPSVAYDEDNNKFLVVWDGNGRIYARAVTVEKITDEYIFELGETFEVSGNADIYESSYYEQDPDLSYDNDNGRFLVIWEDSLYNEDYALNGNDIKGRIVYSDGSFAADNFVVINEIYNQTKPSVSYSYGHEKFLVTWYVNYYNEIEGFQGYVEANVVGDAGEVNAAGKIIINDSGQNPSVAINDLNDQFLVAWDNDDEIYGVYVDLYLNGENVLPQIVSENIYISHDNNDYSLRPLSYFDGFESMLCVWSKITYENEDIYARLNYVDYEGYAGSSFFTDEYEDDRDEIEIYNSNNNNNISISGNNNGLCLIAYIIDGSNAIGYRLIGESPTAEPSLSFSDDSYSVKIDSTKQTTVKLFDFDGIDEQDVTNSGYITYFTGNSDIVQITSSGAITGITAGHTTIGAIYMIPEVLMLDAEADVYVTRKTDSSPSSARTPIGQIIVDSKAVENIYKENVTAQNNIYKFSTDKAGDAAKLWLYSSFFEDLAEDYPERSIYFTWDEGACTIPIKCHEILDETGGSSASKVNIVIEKVKDKAIIDSAADYAEFLGGNLVSDLMNFTVIIEDGVNETEISSYDFYAERTMNKLTSINSANTTAMKFIKNKEILSFAPSVFNGSGDLFKASIKYRGNGIFTILENPQSFSDIESHWARESIEKLASRNIAYGKNNLLFEPDEWITRAEFAVMITRALGITEEEGSDGFGDVSTQWFAEDIRTANEAGLINGRDDGMFYPNEKIMRKDMAVIIYNTLEFIGTQSDLSDIESNLSIFKDKDIIDNYAKIGAATCADAGIIFGRDTMKFDPNDNTTRAEAAAIIERLLRYLEFMN